MNVYSATDLSVVSKTKEVFVADGYINHRVIVFDADTGKYKRHWGAYGNVPDDTAPRTPTYEGPSSQQFNTLNNSDSNGWAYMGVSPFTTVDLRNHWRIDARWSAACSVGVEKVTMRSESFAAASTSVVTVAMSPCALRTW